MTTLIHTLACDGSNGRVDGGKARHADDKLKPNNQDRRDFRGGAVSLGFLYPLLSLLLAYPSRIEVLPTHPCRILYIWIPSAPAPQMLSIPRQHHPVPSLSI
jgi:hypothetical protein